MAFPSPPLSSPVPSYPPFDDFALPSPPPSSPVPSYPPFDDFVLPSPPPSSPVPSYPPFDDFALPSPQPSSPVPSYPPVDDSVPPSYGDAFLSLEDYPRVEAGNFLALEYGNGGGDWGRSLLPGMKFRPTDEEVVVHYLRPQLVHSCSDRGGPITYADIYDYEPHQLSGLVGEDHGDGKMYFYTRIKKIGKSKTDRSVKSKKGYWKPTQAPKPIKGKTGNTIGYKTPLAYYEDKKKTQWLMQEYKLESHNSHHSSHELVVAVVYFYNRRGRGHDGGNDY